MPLILIDLFGVLTGNRAAVRKAFNLLKERRFIKRSKQKKITIKGLIEEKDDNGNTVVKKPTAALNVLAKLTGRALERKVFKLVPPLKDYPEEVESDSTYNSDQTDRVAAKTKLDK